MVFTLRFSSQIKLIPALKGQTGNHAGNLLFRKSLVVFQFVLTIAMIAGSFIIWKQLDFVLKKDMGFNKDHKLFFTSRNMRQQIP